MVLVAKLKLNAYRDPQGRIMAFRLTKRIDGREYSAMIGAQHTLSFAEIAQLERVSTMTVHRWHKAGRLKARKVRGRNRVTFREFARLYMERHPGTEFAALKWR